MLDTFKQKAIEYARNVVVEPDEHIDAVEAVAEDYYQGAVDMYDSIVSFVDVIDALPDTNEDVIVQLIDGNYAIASYCDDMWSVNNVVKWRKLHK